MALRRLSEHRRGSDWYLQISTVTIQTLPDRESAVEAEMKAILQEKPIYNRKIPKPIVIKPKKPRPKYYFSNEIIIPGIQAKEIIQHFGSPTKAKLATGFTLQTFRNWAKNGIPRPAQLAIQAITRGRLKADVAK